MFSKKTHHELSASIEQDFRPDLVTQVGFSGNVTVLAYDPVQSLFAIGTDRGTVQVLGAGEIRAVFDTNPEHKAPSVPILFLRFVTSVYLVVIDERSTIIVYALDTRTEWARYQSPFSIRSCWSDPIMDWLLLGHHNGEVTGFDIDQGRPTYFKLNNLEKLVDPKVIGGSVFSLQFHPRDPALLLLCYRSVAVVWNIVKSEIAYDLHYEVPFTNAVWHPSGSHIVSSHVNCMIVFWDSSKGVKLGARHAFPSLVNTMDTSIDRIPEGLAWCSKEDPTDTFLLVWGGSQVTLIEFGPTPTVATSSYDYMGNFYKSEAINLFELKLSAPIVQLQVCAKVGNPHFQGCYNPSHAVICCQNRKPSNLTLKTDINAPQPPPQLDEEVQIVVAHLPQLQVTPFVSSVLPAALCWRSSPMTTLTALSIPRNQWIGMMATAPPNTKVIGGRSATMRKRKAQLSTVLCMGCLDGTVKLFDGTGVDSQDYRVVMTSVRNVSDVSKVTHVSVGVDAGEMAVSTANGDVILASFGRNKMVVQELPPAPDPRILNVEHLVDKELTQGFIPQWKLPGTGPVTSICQSNIGFAAFGTQSGTVTVIDKRGPAVICETRISGTASVIDFGIVACGTDSYSSILMGVGTSRGDVLLYKLVPRQIGGFEVVEQSVKSLNVGKEPVTVLNFIDQSKGISARASPDVMGRLGSGMLVNGALLAETCSSAKFFALTGPKFGKKLGSKTFDTPIVAASYAFTRAGTSSALTTLNIRGKCGIYGLPSLGTMCTFNALCTPSGSFACMSEMGDAFLPYDPAAHAGQVNRLFGSDVHAPQDDVYQLLRKVPARPVISTAHWVAGRQYVKAADLDKYMAGSRRGKVRRPHNQLIDTEQASEPKKEELRKDGKYFGNKPLPKFVHPERRSRIMPQKTWGQTFSDYYENAEGAVNDALDDAMESINVGGKQAKNTAVKGALGKMFGF